MLNQHKDNFNIIGEKPLEDSTLLDLQIKGSHNSYLFGNLAQQLDFIPNNQFKDGYGVRSIELDIIQDPQTIGNPDEWEFLIDHSLKKVKQKQRNNENIKSFRGMLKELSEWQEDNNQKHMPIFVVLDLKGDGLLTQDYEKFVEKINQQILEVIPRDRIYENEDFLKRGQILNENLQDFQQNNDLYGVLLQYGWPKISQMLGKILFIVSGNEKEQNIVEVRKVFSDLRKNKIGFVDIDNKCVSDIRKYVQENPNRIIYNVSLRYFFRFSWRTQFKYRDNLGINYWMRDRLFKNNLRNKQNMIELQRAQEMGLFLKGYFIMGYELWEKAKGCMKINLMATDNLEGCWTNFLYQEKNGCGQQI